MIRNGEKIIITLVGREEEEGLWEGKQQWKDAEEEFWLKLLKH